MLSTRAHSPAAKSTVWHISTIGPRQRMPTAQRYRSRHDEMITGRAFHAPFYATAYRNYYFIAFNTMYGATAGIVTSASSGRDVDYALRRQPFQPRRAALLLLEYDNNARITDRRACRHRPTPGFDGIDFTGIADALFDVAK